MMLRWTLAVALLAWVLGCRPDPGAPTYSDRDDFSAPFGFAEPLPGPDPYQEGLPRLAFGLFYEGDASDVIPIDDTVVHYYVFDETYSQSSTDDRVEGVAADRIVHAGLGWWGGGIISDTPQDLSQWKTVHLSLKSSSEAFDSMTIGMSSGTGDVTVLATDYGFATDGQWHHLAIPVLDLQDAGLDPGKVEGILLLGGGAADAGAAVLVDNFYLSAAP